MFSVLWFVLNILLLVTITKTANIHQRNVRSNENNELVVEIEDENKAQYLKRNFDTNAYRFGYEVGPDGQFHHENRGPDRITYGCYGHIDPNKNLQATHYVADAYGYRVIEPNNPIVTYQPIDGDQRDGQVTRQVRSWSESHFPKECDSWNTATKISQLAHEVGGIGQSNRPNPIALDVHGKPVSFDSNAAVLPALGFNRNLNTVTKSHHFVRINATKTTNAGGGGDSAENLAYYPIKKLNKNKFTYHHYFQKKPFVSTTSLLSSTAPVTNDHPAPGTSFTKSGVQQVEVESNYQTGSGAVTASSSYGQRLKTANKRKNNILSILADSEDDSTNARKPYSSNVVVLTGNSFEKSSLSDSGSGGKQVLTDRKIVENYNSDEANKFDELGANEKKSVSGLKTAYQFTNNGKFEFSKTNPVKVHLNKLSNTKHSNDFKLTKSVNKDEFWNNDEIFKRKVVVVKHKKVVPGVIGGGQKTHGIANTVADEKSVFASATEIVTVNDERPTATNSIDADRNYSISVENGVLVFKNIQNIKQSVLDDIFKKKNATNDDDDHDDSSRTVLTVGNFEQDRDDAIRNQNQVAGFGITNEYLPQYESKLPTKVNSFGLVGDDHSYSLVSDKNGETKYEATTSATIHDNDDDADVNRENSKAIELNEKLEYVKLKPPPSSGVVYLGNDVRVETSSGQTPTKNPYAETKGGNRHVVKTSDEHSKHEYDSDRLSAGVELSYGDKKDESHGTSALNSLSYTIELNEGLSAVDGGHRHEQHSGHEHTDVAANGIALDQNSGSSAVGISGDDKFDSGYEHGQAINSNHQNGLTLDQNSGSQTSDSYGGHDASGVVNNHNQNGISVDQISGSGIHADTKFTSGLTSSYEHAQNGGSGGIDVAINSYSQNGIALDKSSGVGVSGDGKLSGGYEHVEAAINGIALDQNSGSGIQESTGYGGSNDGHYIHTNNQNVISLDQSSVSSSSGIRSDTKFSNSLTSGQELNQYVGNGADGAVNILDQNSGSSIQGNIGYDNTQGVSGFTQTYNQHGISLDQSSVSSSSGIHSDTKFSNSLTSGQELNQYASNGADGAVNTLDKNSGTSIQGNIGYDNTQGVSGFTQTYNQHGISLDQSSVSSSSGIHSDTKFSNSLTSGQEPNQYASNGADGAVNTLDKNSGTSIQGNIGYDNTQGVSGFTQTYNQHGISLDQSSVSSSSGIHSDTKFSNSLTSGQELNQYVGNGADGAVNTLDKNSGSSIQGNIGYDHTQGVSGFTQTYNQNGISLDHSSVSSSSSSSGVHADDVVRHQSSFGFTSNSQSSSDQKNIDNSQSSFTKFEHDDHRFNYNGLTESPLADKINGDDKIVTIDKWFDSKSEVNRGTQVPVVTTGDTTQSNQQVTEVHVIDDSNRQQQQQQQQQAHNEKKAAQCNVLCLQQNYAYSNRTMLWNYLHDLTNIRSNQTEFETIQRTILLQPIILLPYCASGFDNNLRILDFNTFLPLLQNQSYAKIPYKCANCNAKL